MYITKKLLVAALREEIARGTNLGEELAYQIEVLFDAPIGASRRDAGDVSDGEILSTFEGLIMLSDDTEDETILQPATALLGRIAVEAILA